MLVAEEQKSEECQSVYSNPLGGNLSYIMRPES
jgi:hypothetical protein